MYVVTAKRLCVTCRNGDCSVLVQGERVSDSQLDNRADYFVRVGAVTPVKDEPTPQVPPPDVEEPTPPEEPQKPEVKREPQVEVKRQVEVKVEAKPKPARRRRKQ